MNKAPFDMQIDKEAGYAQVICGDDQVPVCEFPFTDGNDAQRRIAEVSAKRLYAKLNAAVASALEDWL